jgi:hypothetical protein
MMAATGRAIWIKPMFIMSDLKRRLNPEFFASLVSQLSSSKAAPSVSCVWQKEQAAEIPKAKFEANVERYGRMRMAALQT